MEVPKIHLSQAEIKLMCDAEIILTKNSVLKKIRQLLEELQQAQTGSVQNIQQHFEPGLFSIPPKISRGENYLGLPYLILDYPRFSSPKDFFFIRSMFWWGKFFSSTLHIGGDSKERLSPAIRDKFARLQAKQYFINVNNDPWVHHFEEDNYQPLGSLDEKDFRGLVEKTAHLKIAAQFPVEDWQYAGKKMYESWKFLLEVTGLIT